MLQVDLVRHRVGVGLDFMKSFIRVFTNLLFLKTL